MSTASDDPAASTLTAAPGGDNPYPNAWRVMTLLFIINLLNYIDRSIPAVVLEDIRREFTLNDFWLGSLGTAFTLVYAMCGLPLGRLADTWIRKYVLAGGLTVWSGFTALSGWAPNFATFFVMRLGVGVGEAAGAPAAVSMIGDMFPAEKRGRAMGLYMLGLPLGILICFIVFAWIAHETQSWRVPFLVAAVPGFILAVAVLFVREPMRGAQETYVTATTPVDKPFKKVLAVKTIWWLSLAGATLNIASYGTNTFFNSMLQRYYLVDASTAGMMSAAILGLTGLIALTAGGFIADWMHTRSRNGRLKLGSASLLLAALLIYFALNQKPGDDMSAFLVLFFLGWMLMFMFYIAVFTAVQDVVEPRLRASAMSIFFAAQYLLGAAFGTLILGALSDHFALQAMADAGLTEMTEALRGIGLHHAMYLVPAMLLGTGIFLAIATGTYLDDVAKVGEHAMND